MTGSAQSGYTGGRSTMSTAPPRIVTKTVLAGAIGNALEWYDFALYGYFAPVFAALFFPSEYRSVSLISAFSVFAVGFFARPLGALLFGYWGIPWDDARHWRVRSSSWHSQPVLLASCRRS